MIIIATGNGADPTAWFIVLPNNMYINYHGDDDGDLVTGDASAWIELWTQTKRQWHGAGWNEVTFIDPHDRT